MTYKFLIFREGELGVRLHLCFLSFIEFTVAFHIFFVKMSEKLFLIIFWKNLYTFILVSICKIIQFYLLFFLYRLFKLLFFIKYLSHFDLLYRSWHKPFTFAFSIKFSFYCWFNPVNVDIVVSHDLIFLCGLDNLIVGQMPIFV